MKNKDLEQVWGHIIKKEFITSAAAHIIPGTFVLKIGKPFPGLYKDVTIRNIPEFYFLVLQEPYSPLEIINASSEINQRCKYGFNAVAAEITIPSTTYPVIRIKNIQEADCIIELQKEYMEKGYHFNRNPQLIQSHGMVKIIKFFSLSEVGEGIYYDKNVPELGYFEIPDPLEWEVFEKMTYRIKINVALGVFDAAIGEFRMDNKRKNIIRIFNPARNPGNLELIQKAYKAAICNPELMNTV